MTLTSVITRHLETKSFSFPAGCDYPLPVITLGALLVSYWCYYLLPGNEIFFIALWLRLPLICDYPGALLVSPWCGYLQVPCLTYTRVITCYLETKGESNIEVIR